MNVILVIVYMIAALVVLLLVTNSLSRLIILISKQIPFTSRMRELRVLEPSKELYRSYVFQSIIYTVVVVGVFFINFNPVLFDAILFGAICGVAIGLYTALRRRNRSLLYFQISLTTERSSTIVKPIDWQVLKDILAAIESTHERLEKEVEPYAAGSGQSPLKRAEKKQVSRLDSQLQGQFKQLVKLNSEFISKLMKETPSEWPASFDSVRAKTDAIQTEIEQLIEQRGLAVQSLAK